MSTVATTANTRPTSLTVFGVLNVIFGGLGIGGALINILAQGAEFSQATEIYAGHPVLETWITASIWLGMLSSGALLAIGIGLLQLKPFAYRLSIAYAIYAMAITIISYGIQTIFVAPLLEAQMSEVMADSPLGENFMSTMLVAGAVIGALISIGYAALLWYYVSRPANKAALLHTDERAAEVF